MQIKNVITTVLLVFGVAFAFAQPGVETYVNKKTATGNAKKAFDKGMAYTVQNDNEKAIREFEKALKEAPRFIDAQLHLAALQYEMKLYPEAEDGFEKVLAIDPLYNTKVMYTLGITEMQMEKFTEAAEHFQQYLGTETSNTTLLKKAGRYKANCDFMAQMSNRRVPFEPKNIGENINTQGAEYLPSLTADGETMVYTAVVRGQEDFYISRKVDGVWRQGRAMEEINTPLNEGAQSISADGKFLVFTACNRPEGLGSCDLYFSEVRNGRWTKPANMGTPVNSGGWESQPSISADGKTLYFSSAKNFDSENRDIMVSYRQANGSWSKPQNLGDTINTEFSEQSPFIHPDGQTLYFMSNGHPGFGSHDLFYSRKQEDGSWGIPQNLGFPINTAAAEGALVVSLDGTTAYFATDRTNPAEDGLSAFDKPEANGNVDIYYFNLYEEARPKPLTYVKARVYDEVTKKPLIAEVDFVALDNGLSQAASFTDEDGEFLVCLPLGKNYALNVSKEKYIFHSENFALINRDAGKPYVLEIGLQKIPEAEIIAGNTSTPVPASKPIVLRNVFFDTGSARLRDESFIELNRLKDMLVKNPTMKIQINGHTDNVGSEADNDQLSDGRAKAVYDYLINNGIISSRLKYKGFGESQPIDTNDTAEGRQRNRRTEFVVLGS